MFRFRRREVADNPPAVPPERPRVEFLGVGPGEVHLPAFPYEFTTDEGVVVRMHDMQFLGLEYCAHTAELTLRAIYDDPAHTPAGTRKTPVATLRFTDVDVQRWQDLHEPGPDPDRICAMHYVESRRLVELVTGRTNLVFTTRRMSVSMEPSR